MSLTESGSHLKRQSTRPNASPSRRPEISQSPASASSLTHSSATRPSHSALPLVSQKNLRHFSSLVHKFHESVFEFDRRYKLLSIWSSNRALSYELRRPGKSLQAIVGRETARFLRTIFGRISPGHGAQTFRFPVRVDRVPHWFAASVDHFHALPENPSSRSDRATRQRRPADLPHFVLKVQDITAHHEIEERLRKSELMLKHAEENAEIGTWELTLADGTVRFSDHLCKLLGLSPSQSPLTTEGLWRTLNCKHTGKLRGEFQTAIRAGLPFKFSEPYTLPNGAIRILDGLSAPVADSNGKIVRVIGITRDVTSQARTQASMRWLSHQLLTIRSDEQRRMSRELHETTSQTLAALKMTLAQIGRSVPRNSGIQGLLRTSRGLVNAAVREVRFVSSFLHPPLLDETGLLVALRSYAKLFAERGGAPVQVHIADDFGRLEKELELTVFRIVQESLTNVHRHAKASAASVRVERSANSVAVEIKDDGIGIFQDIPEASQRVPLGVGIPGIRERVNQLHGEFDIISAPGQGTTIRASLPLNATKEIHHDFKVDAKRDRRAKTLSDPPRRRSSDRTPRNSRVARR
jgi:signal transduction histidine kinase